MNITIIGGTGLIGRKLAAILKNQGHNVTAASPSTGVNTLTGEGLLQALTGADILVDVANSPSFEDEAVMDFFATAGRNIAAAAEKAGVKHHIALSVVGTQRMQSSGYFRAKAAQEDIIRSTPVPFTVVHATQFFEFVTTIAAAYTQGDLIPLPPSLLQPIAADDVAAALARVTGESPANGIIEIAGPEKIGIDELVRRYLAATGDSRRVVTDPAAGYFGAPIDDRTLTPDDGARLSTTRFDTWLEQFQPQPA